MDIITRVGLLDAICEKGIEISSHELLWARNLKYSDLGGTQLSFDSVGGTGGPCPAVVPDSPSADNYSDRGRRATA